VILAVRGLPTRGG